MCLLFFACHGMSKNSMQWVVLNEYDTKTEFYKLHNAEEKIRVYSKNYMNCYFISLFACCREIFAAKKHRNCIAASSIADAEEKFNKAMLETELQKNQSVDQELDFLKRRNALLEKRLETLENVNDDEEEVLKKRNTLIEKQQI